MRIREGSEPRFAKSGRSWPIMHRAFSVDVETVPDACTVQTAPEALEANARASFP